MAELDFTGERVVPGRVDPQLEFEHLSRYRLASQWVAGASVVDLGSGAGYGAALLKSAGARRVVGVDIALDATLFSRQTYAESDLHFVTGDCARRCLRSGWADVVTAFEIIEHLESPPSLLEFARDLLAERGLFVLSTPNKKVYSDERKAEPNPFHVEEFYYEEFCELLGEFFPHVAVLGQSTTEGMLFTPLQDAGDPEASLATEASDASLRETTDYFVAVCGFGEEVAKASTRSRFMVSSGNELRRRSRMIDALQTELEDRTRWAKTLDATVSEKTAEVSRKISELADKEAEVAEKSGRLSELQEELEARQKATQEIEAAAERSRREVVELRGHLRILERLERRTRRLEADGSRSEQRLAALAVQLDVAGDLIRELEAEQADLEALLAWQRESAVVQAERMRAIEEREEVLERRAGTLEEASYQHQMGLEYHNQELARLNEHFGAVGEEAQRQSDELARMRAVEAEVGKFLGSRLWRTYSRLAGGWHRLLGRKSAEEEEIARRVEAVTRSLVRSPRPRLTIAMPVLDRVDPLCDSLASLAASDLDLPYEVVVVGQAHGPLARALEATPVVRFVTAGRGDGVIALAASKGRGDHLLFLAAGVQLERDTIDQLRASFSRFSDAGVVAPRLKSADGERQLAFGGAVDGAGRPYCRGLGEDWESLEFSFTQPAAFAPGVCFMASRSLMRRVARRGEAVFDELAAAADLGRRIWAEGSGVYVQAGASAQCSAAVEEALTAPASRSGTRAAALRDGERARWDDNGPRILIVDHRLPTPDQDSGSLRMSHILDILHDFGCSLTLIAGDRLPIQPYCSALQRDGVEVVSRPWVVSLERYIEQQAHRFDGAIVCRCDVADEFMETVRSALGDKPVIFDTVDLQFLREQRRARIEANAELATRAEAVRRRELALARQADAVVVVSDYELDLLRGELPEADVRLISNIHRVPGSARGFFGRKDVFFVGGFEHQPNVDAVHWLVEEILPLVRRRIPTLHAYVIGSKPTAEVRALASDSVTIEGFVPDLTPYLEGCRLSLAPLRYGAGVKGKVNQSLAHGVPCVMTPVAAEGMGLRHRHDAMVAESAEDFADAIAELYRKPWLWYRLSRNGVRNTRERFSVELARRAIGKLLTDLGLLAAERDSSGAEGR